MGETEQDKQDHLWGDGADAGMHPALAVISDSLRQDMPLADADLRGSAAYALSLIHI